MRIFDKQVNANIRSDLMGRLGMIVISGMLLVLVGVCSFAWFAKNDQTSNSGLQVALRTDNYEILIERNTRYDSGYPVITDTDFVKDDLATEYSLSATSTSVSPSMAYELVNEYRYEDTYNMMPGAYGTLSFYIRPTSAEELIISFVLDLGGYVTVYDNEGNASLEKVAGDVVLDLLKGHVLFFTSRTGATYANYCYDGLIQNGTFTFNSSTASLCGEEGMTDCYKVTLYWEWPVTYFDIVDEISTESVTRRFPQTMTTYLGNGEYFFYGTPDHGDEAALSDAYNDGDQAIGTGTDCIMVYLNVL